jgi:23S rRNA (cytosine1962-C5)-methyltransferase
MDLPGLLDRALNAREGLLDPSQQTALRLFNGFHEGHPALAVDLYARTLVIHDYSERTSGDEATAKAVVEQIRGRWPFVRAALWKARESGDAPARNGRLLLGGPDELDKRVLENGVWYALALDLNRDASLYLDTRNLRAWAKQSLAGKNVLNTFAYTGSLGVAASAAPASEVIHVDRNAAFLEIARQSYALNGFVVRRGSFRCGDFFEAMGRLKKEQALFDCVLLDPPFFSQTDKGRVDLEAEADRLLNKARPLVGDGGALVVVNNALFASGAQWMASLERLCGSGYLTFEQRIDVPEDVTGFAQTRVVGAPVDPAPFNHSTKIAILRVRRKDGRKA